MSSVHTRRAARVLVRVTLVLGLGWLLALGLYVLDPVPLGVPVAGVPRERLVSTFGAPRSEGRTHEGVDIFAPRGTPVLAAHDGVVLRVGQYRLGGTVIHTLGRRGVIAYYAHLDRVRPDLRAGLPVREGETIGWVGNTGNARTTPPHLHFEARPIALGLPARDPVPLLGGPDRPWRPSRERRTRVASAR